MIDEVKLHKVIANIFGVPENSICDDSSPDNIENWDSVNHIHLLIALEEEFGVELTPEDSIEMLSVKLVKMILTEALNR